MLDDDHIRRKGFAGIGCRIVGGWIKDRPGRATKVSSPKIRSRNGRNKGLPLSLSQALVIPEEKCLVLDYWATDGPAKLILHEVWQATEENSWLALKVSLGVSRLRP